MQARNEHLRTHGSPIANRIAAIALMTFACGACAPRRSSDSAPPDRKATCEPEPPARRGQFQPIATAHPTAVGRWVVDPAEPMTLYALGERPMWSSDGGRTWCALDWPAQARELLFATRSQDAMYLVTEFNGASRKLWRSTDRGRTWMQTGSAPDVSTLHLVDAAGYAVFIGDDAGRMLWRSEDEGRIWVSVDPRPRDIGAPLDLTSVLAVPADPPLVVVTTDGLGENGFVPILLVSRDAGVHFERKAIPASVRSLGDSSPVSFDCEGSLYVPDDSSLHRSSDGGSSWHRIPIGSSASTSTRVSASHATACPGPLFGLNPRLDGMGWWQLDRDGTARAADLPEDIVDGSTTDLHVLGDRQFLFGLHRSTDGGRSWWRAGASFDVANLWASPARRGRMFVSTVRGLHRSDDAGRTWHEHRHDGGWSICTLTLDPKDGDLVYATSVYADDAPWTFLSRDGGKSFVGWPVPDARAPETPELVVPSPRDPRSVTVVTRRNVYTTDDAGHSFRKLAGFPGGTFVLKATSGGGDPAALYVVATGLAGTRASLLASLDGGTTWTASHVASSWIDWLVAHPTERNVAFAWTLDGGDPTPLLRTTDGGKTWSPVRKPASDSCCSSLDIDPRPPHALYATGDRVYRSDDRGESWRVAAELPGGPSNREWRASRLTLDPHENGVRYMLGRSGVIDRLIE